MSFNRKRSQWKLPAPVNARTSLTRREKLGLPRPRRRRQLACLLFTILLSIPLFLVFLRHSPKTKQAVEDFIRYTTDDLGLRSDQKHALGLPPSILAKIWAYDISSGYYPLLNLPPPRSFRRALSETAHLTNPAIPSSWKAKRKNDRIIPNTGGERLYISSGEYRARPFPGTTLDLEHVLKRCAFENGQYVSSCLERLAATAGLKNTTAQFYDPKLTYVTKAHSTAVAQAPIQEGPFPDLVDLLQQPDQDPTRIVQRPFPSEYVDAHQDAACFAGQPKIFHIFWSGAFTDKPYTAALSFLYSQNVGLHLEKPPLCPPQLWFWLVPGPAHTSLNTQPNAQAELDAILRKNRWASALLEDDRFSNVISFKLFNATEHLDATPELCDSWRSLPLFKSGSGPAIDVVEHAAQIAGSQTADTYDKLSVVLSDMARFLLCHRFGGIYLDADTLLLRDYEELWNYPGAFAYRWSRMREYNTAIMKLNRGSALGSFILKTALVNELDFHPHSVWQYLSKAGLEQLFLRLPDALFDPAWLNVEYFQRNRPAQPYFENFDQFFKSNTLSPSIADPHGQFFVGAFAYHWHNNWWTPFDKIQDYPNIALGASSSLDHEAALKGNDMDHGLIPWCTALKRQWESFLRGDISNMYDERIRNVI